MSEEKKFLSIRNLEAIYTSGKKTVQTANKVSLDLEKGETLTLVGETGAGKITIARSILDILPSPPSKVLGREIWLEGKELLGMPKSKKLKIKGEKIVIIFQDPMITLNPLMTVGDQIAEGFLLHNDHTKEETVKQSEEMLEMVGISKARYTEYPFEFSGGIKQHVMIAMALVCNPLLLLADEPATALGVTIQAQVLDLIKELRNRHSTSMILITHDLGVVAQTSDYVAVIYAGSIIEYASEEKLFLHPAHPYTIGLFGSLPSMIRGQKRLKPIAGSLLDPTCLPGGCPSAPRCFQATELCKQDIPFVEVEEGYVCRHCNLKVEN